MKKKISFRKRANTLQKIFSLFPLVLLFLFISLHLFISSSLSLHLSLVLLKKIKMEARTSKENEEEEEKKKEFSNDDSFLKKDKKEDEEEERRRIASLIAETSYLTSVLNAPSGEATTTASSSSNDYDYYDFGFTSAVYSLFGYASEDGNTGSATNNNNNINNNKMMMMMEKESNLLLDEKRIEQTLLKNHGVIKKTLPEVSPTDFEKYLRAIRTSYARFVATRAMAKKKNKSAGTASKSSSAGSALADGFAATNNMNADDFEEQMHRQNQLLSSVPSIFFREEFDLTSREAFEEILPCLVSDLVGESNNNNNNNNNNKTSLDDDNVANSAVLAQEQLGQYLDLVESVIMKRVGDRAEAFLEAMAKTKKLQETIEETKKAVVDLRTNNRRSFRRAAHATAKVKETSRRRDNILRLAETLKDIENIRQTKLDVDVLLESGEYSECLEAIDECERSLRAAIERATKNNSEEGEVEEEKGSSSMSSASNKHMNISNSSGGKSNAATTTTKNVFSCFSHLPKDLEIAKRKCTGAITAELCSRARVESNIVDDGIANIVKYGVDDQIKDDEGSFDKDEYDRVSESILPALRGLLRSSTVMPTVDAIHAVSREILRDLKRDVERVCEKVFASVGGKTNTPSKVSAAVAENKNAEDGNMENIYLALQNCSSENYIRTLDAVSKIMSRLHFKRGEIIRDVLMSVFTSSSDEFGENASESAGAVETPKSLPSPKFSMDFVLKEARDEANERFSRDGISKAVFAIRESSNSIIDGGSMLFARLLSCRKHVNAKLDATSFTRITKASDAFIRLAENANKKNGKRCVALRSQVHSQARLFLNVKHAAELDKLKTLLEQESWSQATVPAHFQELLDRLSAVASSTEKDEKKESNAATNAENDKNQPLPTKIIDKNTKVEHVATTTALMLIRTLNDYSDIAESIPDLSADVARRVAELLGAFNDGACVLVLGAQAMQGANLRSITAKHLSVTQQSLRLFQSLAPVLKAKLSDITTTKFGSSSDNVAAATGEGKLPSIGNEDARRKLAFANLDKVGRDFETHCERIHLKLIEIIRERLRFHRGTLPQLAKAWENEPLEDFDKEASQFSKGLMKELGTLSKVVRGMFEENDQNNVLGVVALEFDAKLASSLRTVWEERKSVGGTIERHVKADCEALRECLHGLAGKFDSDIIGRELKELAEVVAESIKHNDARLADEAKLLKAKMKAMAAEAETKTPTKSPTPKKSTTNEENMDSAPASTSSPPAKGEEAKDPVAAASPDEDERKDENAKSDDE
jgi:vacuolar protein sorting-associated protein 54